MESFTALIILSVILMGVILGIKLRSIVSNQSFTITFERHTHQCQSSETQTKRKPFFSKITGLFRSSSDIEQSKATPRIFNLWKFTFKFVDNQGEGNEEIKRPIKLSTDSSSEEETFNVEDELEQLRKEREKREKNREKRLQHNEDLRAKYDLPPS